MARIKKLPTSVTSLAAQSGESVCTDAAKAISFTRDQEGRMYVDCGPSYYDEGPAEQSRYMGKPAKKGS
jgi:hypothetical protein